LGGKTLVESIGLLDAARVQVLTASWPMGHTTQTCHDLAADQAIEITGGADSFKVLRPARTSGSRP
jgi:hypothetical protein